MARKKKTNGLTMLRYGILNPFGSVWTPDTFGSEGEAQRHLSNFYAQQIKSPDLSTFKVVQVEVTVRPVE